ncbi:MAG: pyrroline-5-carboxylate reductase [Candidatus Brocadiaceae bacterium]|jgi:pyrroline-5-carboxylate reductase
MIERRIGFIGAGLMAEALIKGMLDAGAAGADRLYAADPSAHRRKIMGSMVGQNVFADNAELVKNCDVVVFSIKPGVVPAVARQIAGRLTPQHLVVSIAAGVGLGDLREMLDTDRLVRVMPNTPALVGTGAAAYCTDAGTKEGDAQVVESMLDAVGICVRVHEEQMDAVTGLSGSGPAYVYLVIEALSDGAVKMGLPRAVSRRLAAQTVLGAAKMVLETGRHPGELKDQVATPGGTTIEAIHALESAGVRKAFMDAVVAATMKARSLMQKG